MKTSFYFLTLFMLSYIAQGQSFSLAGYQWKNRVLLIFAPNANSISYKRQTSLLSKTHDAFQERDLVTIHVFKTSGQVEENSILTEAQTRQLRRCFAIQSDDFCVILIGKDGDEKLRQTEVLLPEELFGVIDAMPMRRQEMQNPRKQ